MNAEQVHRPCEAETACARIGGDGLELADLVQLVVPPKRERHWAAVRQYCAIVQQSRFGTHTHGIVSPVSVIVPTRSLDQRLSALQRANEVRVGRSRLKKQLAAGTCRIEDLLTETPELALSARIYDLLLAVPKLGRVRVSKLLRHCRISEAKTLAGLTERQRAELLATLRRDKREAPGTAALPERIPSLRT
jgi:hypothetical protein